MRNLWRRFSLYALLVCGALTISAHANSRPWEVLTDCRLLEWGGNDGDSFRVAHEDASYVFRLYFVDTPEVHDTYPERLQDQARYFQIDRDQVIEFGKTASAFTKRFLADGFTVSTRWLEAGSDHQKRFYALVQNRSGEYLSEALVRHGLARIYGMPTREPWPGGQPPDSFLAQLNRSERHAQQSMQGIWPLANSPSLRAPNRGTASGYSDPATTAVAPARSNSDRININTASIGQLETLPGIGPAFAARIVGARPIPSIEALANISGIGPKLIAELTPLIKIEEPPPPPLSAAFYRKDPETYLNTQVTVLVKSVAISQEAAPEGFKAAILDTGPITSEGGSITAYIPEAFFDTFLHYYQSPGREFTGLFYQKVNTTVLVYPRQ